MDLGPVWIPWQNFSPALLAHFFAMGIQTGGLKVTKWEEKFICPFAPQEALNWAKSALGVHWTPYTPTHPPATADAVLGEGIEGQISHCKMED